MAEKDYRVLSDLSQIASYSALAVDTEGDSLNKMRARLSGISFCGEPRRAFWLPAEAIDAPKLQQMLRQKRLAFHHAKFDLTILERHDIDLEDAEIFDTLLAAHLLDENRPKSLKRLARDLLDEEAVDFNDLNQLTLFGKNPDLAEYACADADYTFRLYELFKAEIDELPTLAHLYYEYELPTMRILRKMEQTGICLDIDHLKRIGDEYRLRIRELEERIWEHAGRRFHVNSTVELGKVLFGDLALPSDRQTRSGRQSVNQWALESLRHRHPVVPLILEHRELTTLLANYVDKLPQLVLPETGRIHCNFNQTGTITGRLSSNDPNLQAIPRGATIRSAFVAEEDHVLIDVDFSQVELRCAAHYAQDPKMMEAFEQDVDLHKKTIADIFDKPIEEVTAEERDQAKALNFGLIYGMGAKALSSATGLSLTEAKAFIEAYFTTYKNVRQIREDVLAYTRRHGHIVNMFGRRRRFPEGNVRTAFNSMIQGTAADICRNKMIALDNMLPSETRMLVQVHDELILEAPRDKAGEYVDFITSIMESPVEDAKGRLFRVPCRRACGRCWRRSASKRGLVEAGVRQNEPAVVEEQPRPLRVRGYRLVASGDAPVIRERDIK